ncbi:Major facilitator superfamily [Neofusicoccum parvum]|uniref:Major facilitator superfamily n=1 Tax=Neofusicoccum parvum TaxID=310453 RepID=A0ACB5S5C6_9PEZI|nr:Major facilitator superfamily [Neofusicoccum parvum]
MSASPTDEKAPPSPTAKPFASLDASAPITIADKEVAPALTTSLRDADEALAFLSNHPRASAIAAEGAAILEDEGARKRLLRKIDWTITPLLAGTYFLQFLDKNTLSYTSVMGIRKDTGLKGQEYSHVSMLFYIGFLATEFPTQYLAQRVSRLGLYLGTNIVLWGIVLCCHAATSSFAGLAVCRTLLGVFEACVAPILVLIIAMWYRKEEQGTRVSWFYVCNSVTKIFGGLVAYGISWAETSFATWRIFFLAIGVLTMAVGVLVCVFLPDSPVKAKRFSDAEKVAALMRVKENQSGTQNNHVKKDQIIEAFSDLRVWLIFLSVMLSSIPNGGLSNFNNILLTTFGYTDQQALILDAPNGAIGIVFVLGAGYLSDRWNDRSTVMLICIVPTILAAALMYGFVGEDGTPHNKAALLAASFLSGTFGAGFMINLAWNASNIAGHSKKVTVNALTLVAFCTGNILGTQTFQSKEAPGYDSGKISIMACLSASCLVVVALRMYNGRLNKKKEAELAAMEPEEREALREKMAFADETDRRNPFFRYTH